MTGSASQEHRFPGSSSAPCDALSFLPGKQAAKFKSCVTEQTRKEISMHFFFFKPLTLQLHLPWIPHWPATCCSSESKFSGMPARHGDGSRAPQAASVHRQFLTSHCTSSPPHFYFFPSYSFLVSYLTQINSWEFCYRYQEQCSFTAGLHMLPSL